MRHERLPSTLNKKYPNDHPEVELRGQPMPNTVSITNTAYNKGKGPNGTDGPPLKFEIAAERFEYPQFDSYDEFVADAGSPEKALEIINDITRNASTAAGKNVIRLATTGEEEDIIEAGLRASRTYSWKEEATLTVKDKASKLDELTSLAQQGKITGEELMARMLELAK